MINSTVYFDTTMIQVSTFNIEKTTICRFVYFYWSNVIVSLKTLKSLKIKHVFCSANTTLTTLANMNEVGNALELHHILDLCIFAYLVPFKKTHFILHKLKVLHQKNLNFLQILTLRWSMWKTTYSRIHVQVIHV